MNKYFLFLILIISVLTSCKKSYNKIEIIFSKTNSRDSIPIRYSLFKLSKGDSIFYNKEIRHQINLNRLYLFDSLPDGDYKIEYSNITNDTFRKNISLKNNQIYKSEIIFDSLPLHKFYKSVPINNLKNGESYKQYSWGGCTSTMHSFYEIKNNNDKYYFNSYTEKNKKLTETDLKAIERFEAEIYFLNGKGSCNSTGQMVYTFSKKENKIDTLREMTCNWHGYEILMRELNSKKTSIYINN